uniref:Uncharacterized protein n=1 Tax=Siphoviridae sp. ctgBD49 TaxID=2826420 RepID=A0A8S5QQM4_9CAUD|nr:MAG TPA: hypothetical protein [Siphoviridae sp. ctgBD49]
MNTFDMLRFQGFVAGAIVEGFLVSIVAIVRILIGYAKTRRIR